MQWKDALPRLPLPEANTTEEIAKKEKDDAALILWSIDYIGGEDEHVEDPEVE